MEGRRKRGQSRRKAYWAWTLNKERDRVSIVIN